ncbi:MAG: diaminopimelate epimerase [Holosporaceae bacterium]|jgi:diaminopimelate epimerase|nr:diaminopimelate epimerase [Holosporaceae bacterium]
MLVKFDKMQGLGNDFVMVDAEQFHSSSSFSSKPENPENRFASLAIITEEEVIRLCDRHYGIGCDQLVVYKLENDAVYANFFNPDGSEAEICGNAARCLGLLTKDRAGSKKFDLKTLKKTYPIQTDDEICVGMGKPSFLPEDVGFSRRIYSDLKTVLEETEVELDSLTEEDVSDYLEQSLLGVFDFCNIRGLGLPSDLGVEFAVCVSIGNPHLVLFCKKTPRIEDAEHWGRKIQNRDVFENGINVSFACVKSENEIDLRVYERGVGPTLACGSGACAAAAAAYNRKLVKSSDILTTQKGGTLKISIDKDGNVFQTGSAAYVFTGEIKI